MYRIFYFACIFSQAFTVLLEILRHKLQRIVLNLKTRITRQKNMPNMKWRRVSCDLKRREEIIFIAEFVSLQVYTYQCLHAN